MNCPSEQRLIDKALSLKLGAQQYAQVQPIIENLRLLHYATMADLRRFCPQRAADLVAKLGMLYKFGIVVTTDDSGTVMLDENRLFGCLLERQWLAIGELDPIASTIGIDAARIVAALLVDGFLSVGSLRRRLSAEMAAFDAELLRLRRIRVVSDIRRRRDSDLASIDDAIVRVCDRQLCYLLWLHYFLVAYSDENAIDVAAVEHLRLLFVRHVFGRENPSIAFDAIDIDDFAESSRLEANFREFIEEIWPSDDSGDTTIKLHRLHVTRMAKWFLHRRLAAFVERQLGRRTMLIFRRLLESTKTRVEDSCSSSVEALQEALQKAAQPALQLPLNVLQHELARLLRLGVLSGKPDPVRARLHSSSKGEFARVKYYCDLPSNARPMLIDAYTQLLAISPETSSADEHLSTIVAFRQYQAMSETISLDVGARRPFAEELGCLHVWLRSQHAKRRRGCPISQ